MKKTAKVLSLALALVLLMTATVFGTMAWLSDTTDDVVNTFTIGKVDITLAETTGNSYKMIPGEVAAKDPTVTVLANSENCWVFVKVTETNGEYTVGTEQTSFDDYISYSVRTGAGNWTALDGVDDVYYIEVTASTDDQEFYVLTGGTTENTSGQVSYSENITNDMMKAITTGNEPTLTFTAYAIQKDGFANALAAWNEVSKAA